MTARPWNPADYRIARQKMIDRQLEARGIKDPRVLTAMTETPRHIFVDEALGLRAYGDTPLPIGDGQTISQPYIVAFMCERLELKPSDRVLEIGFGSGYQTALLSALAGEVFAVERLPGLYEKGRQNLARLNRPNIHLKLGDGTLGWPEEAPFAAIIVAAGGPGLPPPLAEQLAPSGRLIIPIGAGPDDQKLILARKDSSGRLSRQPLATCRFVSLVGRHGF